MVDNTVKQGRQQKANEMVWAQSVRTEDAQPPVQTIVMNMKNLGVVGHCRPTTYILRMTGDKILCSREEKHEEEK